MDSGSFVSRQDIGQCTFHMKYIDFHLSLWGSPTQWHVSVMVFSLANGEEAVEVLKQKFTDLIAKHGTLGNVEEWGKRKLAYPINYENDGYYIVIDFTSDEAFPQELDRVINITDGVLRSLIVAKGE